MQSGFFLDVVVRQGPAIFQLLSGKDETLLIWGNALLILDFGFDILDGVRWLNFECNSLASQSFDENLHASSETEHKMQSGFFLNIVVRQGPAIFQLLSSKDETLLIWGNAFLILDFGLNVFNGVRWFDLKGNSFSSQGLDKDLHASSETEYQVKG